MQEHILRFEFAYSVTSQNENRKAILTAKSISPLVRSEELAFGVFLYARRGR